MDIRDVRSEAASRYEEAYGVHYKTKDLRRALRLYGSIMVTHGKAPEVRYARSQIQNIVKSVVPKQELLDAQAKLALAHIERPGGADVETAPATPPESKPNG